MKNCKFAASIRKLALGAALLLAPRFALAGDICAGDLTGRTITIDTRTVRGFGKVQGFDQLPLASGEYLLTVDDGPYGSTTHELLQILAVNCVPATFFLIGQRATSRPDLLREIVLAGQTVGNHSFTHPDLSKLSYEEILQEVKQGANAIESAAASVHLSIPPLRLIRLPGSNNGSAIPDAPLVDAIQRNGLTIAGYDISGEDWRGWPAENSLALLKKRLGNRGVIVIHDAQANTKLLLPLLLNELRLRRAKVVRLELK